MVPIVGLWARVRSRVAASVPTPERGPTTCLIAESSPAGGVGLPATSSMVRHVSNRLAPAFATASIVISDHWLFRYDNHRPSYPTPMSRAISSDMAVVGHLTFGPTIRLVIAAATAAGVAGGSGAVTHAAANAMPSMCSANRPRCPPCAIRIAAGSPSSPVAACADSRPESARVAVTASNSISPPVILHRPSGITFRSPPGSTHKTISRAIAARCFTWSPLASHVPAPGTPTAGMPAAHSA